MKTTKQKSAAQCIRADLKAAFPGTKFSVRKGAGSRDSVTVSWNLGPTNEAVSTIANKYQAGHFDGMTDSYEYDRSRPANAVRFVFCDRNYDGNDGFEIICKDLCGLLGMEWEGHNTRRGDEFVSSIARRIVAKHDLTDGYHGLERTECTCGLTEDFYRPMVKELVA